MKTLDQCPAFAIVNSRGKLPHGIREKPSIYRNHRQAANSLNVYCALFGKCKIVPVTVTISLRRAGR